MADAAYVGGGVRAASPGRTTSRSAPRRPITGWCGSPSPSSCPCSPSPGRCCTPPSPSARWPRRTTTRRSSPGSSRPTCSRARTRCTSSSRPARPGRSSPIYDARPPPGRLPSTRRARCRPTAARSSATLDRQSAAEERWDAVAQTAIDARNARRGAPDDGRSAARDRAVEDFLAANRDYQRVLDARRVEELEGRRARPGEADLRAQRRVRRDRAGAASSAAAAPSPPSGAVETEHDDVERRYADGQARFGEAMQVAENQAEGHELLVRHLEAGAPDAAITVLIRNNSGDRLEPAMPLPERLPARRAAGARQAARLPRRAPQPPGRPGRRQRRDHHAARSAACGRASRPASRCWSAARSSAPC